VFLLSTVVLAATVVKGKVVSVQDGKVTVDVGSAASKIKEGDKVKIEKEETKTKGSKESTAPSMQGKLRNLYLL